MTDEILQTSNEEKFQSGANIDTRSSEAKALDYQFKELVASVNPVIWVEKTPDKWRKFPIFNQDGSGSCVAQTLAKLLGILYWLKNNVYVHFSATHIYQRRVNKPSGGMAGVDAFGIAQKGVTLEELVPSQAMSDTQMDGTLIPQYKQDVGAIFKIPNYISLPVKDIETIASVIQTTGKGVMLWFYFEYNEWTDHPAIINPNLDVGAGATNRHSVTGVDFALWNGKKGIVIEDSWGPNFGLNGQRFIDEDFFKVRNWYAAYPINFQFDDQTQPSPNPSPVPHYVFNKDLYFGMTDPDIKALQDILRYEGLYPANAGSTGYFGSVTLSAVQKFQVKYEIASAGQIGYGRVGPKTRTKLNQLYGS